jgi:hypothetical protein
MTSQEYAVIALINIAAVALVIWVMRVDGGEKRRLVEQNEMLRLEATKAKMMHVRQEPKAVKMEVKPGSACYAINDYTVALITGMHNGQANALNIVSSGVFISLHTDYEVEQLEAACKTLLAHRGNN